VKAFSRGYLTSGVRFCFNFEAKIDEVGRILAIDYGNRRTGIAVTDPGQMIASPLHTVATHELMRYLENYLREEPVEVMVVGYPRKLDNTDSEGVKQIRFFVQAFKKRFQGIPVEWMDERFTSRMASEALRAGGMNKQQRRVKGNVDKVSAALILQSFLEQRNNMTR
jgi:putative Holliday junction resolvase